MDRVLWITWYNLPKQGRDAYLSWLHGTYIPEMLKRPGYLWAAHYASLDEVKIIRSGRVLVKEKDPVVPAGDRYILIFGAKDSVVFGNPAPGKLHAEMPAESRKMLAMRTGERVNIMAEAARVDGPEARQYREGMVPGPCIQFGSFNCALQDEQDALSWYSQWRLPTMSTLRGCVRTRQLVSIAGWAKHAILYEFVSLEGRDHFLVKHEAGQEQKDWTDKFVQMLTHAPGSPNIALRIWPPVPA